MIDLLTIREKLQLIFNGTDTETQGNIRPINDRFEVAIAGIFLDTASDKHSNFIPVFLSGLNGSYQPIKGLAQADYTIPVSIYVPARMRDKILELQEYLVECFVGSTLTFGGVKCITNISPASIEDIIELNLVNQFKSWVANTYARQIEISETYVSISFNLFISTNGGVGMYGNEVNYQLSFTSEGTTYTDDEPLFIETSISTNSETSSEQILGENTTKSIPMSTSYANSISLIIKKNNNFYNKLLEIYFDGDLQTFDMDLTIRVGENLEFIRKMFVVSSSLRIAKGELLSIRLDFAPKKV